MEKSLSKIEESLTTVSEKSSKNNTLNNLVSSLDSMLSSITSSKISKQKADIVLSFAKGLVELSNEIKPTNAKRFTETMIGIGEGLDNFINIVTPIKLLKLIAAKKILFEGDDSVIKSIVAGISGIFKNVDTTGAKKFSDTLKMLSEGINKFLSIFTPVKIMKLIVAGNIFKTHVLPDIIDSVFSSFAKVNIAGAKKFSDALSYISESLDKFMSIISPVKIMKLSSGAQKMFGGKNPPLKMLAEGLSSLSESIKVAGIKKFSDAMVNIGIGIDVLVGAMSPSNLMKLWLGTKLLFGGEKSVLKRIVEGMSSTFEDANTKKIKEGTEAIQLMGESLLTLTKALGKLALLSIAAPFVLLGALVAKTVVKMFVSFGDKAEGIKAGGEAIKVLSKGLSLLAGGIALIALAVAVTGPALILEAIVVISAFALVFNLVGKAHDSITKGAKSLAWVGLSLFAFSAGLATYMLALILATPKLVLEGILYLAAFGLTFALMGKADKYIAQGALVMIGMAVALFLFSGGLMVYGLALKMFTFEDMILGSLLITEIGFAMFMLGKWKERIFMGATSMAMMGVGLGLFSIGLTIFGLAVKLFSFESIVLGALVITGVGLAIAGVGLLATQIVLGSIVLASMGVGLALFSVGLIVFGGSVKILQSMFRDLFEAGKIAGSIILGVGLAVAGVGALSLLIVPGAVALASIGIGLSLFSVGLLVFVGTMSIVKKIFQDPAEVGTVAGNLITKLGIAFMGVGAMSLLIIPGAAAIATIGAGLLILSAGLVTFVGSVKVLKYVFNSVDEATNSIQNLVVNLGWSFVKVGLMSPMIILGSASLLLMGTSFLAFSVGLLSFGGVLKFLNNNGLIIRDDDGKETLKGVKILSGIAASISRVGLYAFNPFFAAGIGISLGLGASMASIGTGLMIAAKALNEVKNMSAITDGIFGDDGLVSIIAEQLSKIGKKYRGSFISMFFGTDDVSMGIRITKGFGDVLSELAGGIVAFSDFTKFPVKVPDPKDPSRLIYSTVDIFSDVIPELNENLPKLLTVLSSTFSDIGNRFGGESGWFGKDNLVQKGIDTVAGLGKVLSEIAGGVVAFSNFEAFPVQIPDPKDPSKLIYRAINLFDVLPKIKEVLIGDGTVNGKLTGKTGILMGLAEVFAEIGNKYGEGFFVDSAVKKGVDAVQGIGSVVSELAEGIVAFANIDRGLPNYDENGKFNGTYTKFTFDDIRTNIIKVLTSLPSIFAELDVTKIEDAKNKAHAIVPLAESFEKIGKALSQLSDVKKYDNNFIVTISQGIKTIITDINNIQFDENKIKLLGDLGKSLHKFEGLSNLKEVGQSLKGFGPDFSKFMSSVDMKEPDVKKLESIHEVLFKMATLDTPLTKLSKSLELLGTSFRTFGTGFSSFSTHLDKFQKFENVFSSLSKNSHEYQFTEFAKSMGTLKTNVNAFNLENLKLTDSLMKSLSVLSKSNDVSGVIRDSIDKAMAELIKAIDKVSENSGKQAGFLEKLDEKVKNIPVKTETVIVKNQETKAPDKPLIEPVKVPIVPPLTKDDMKDAFKAALSAYGAAKEPGI